METDEQTNSLRATDTYSRAQSPNITLVHRLTEPSDLMEMESELARLAMLRGAMSLSNPQPGTSSWSSLIGWIVGDRGRNRWRVSPSTVAWW